jgi:hypothetical protein
VLVPGRTEKQCWHRWQNSLNPKIDRATGRTGTWTAVEDGQLQDAVKVQGDQNWGAIAAMVPDRVANQCRYRWHSALDPNRASGRTGKWTKDEDIKLKAAVQTHGGKNWGAIAALVPGRTHKQCWNRWHTSLNRNIDRPNGRMGKWAKDEDIKLKDAVQTQGDQN